MWLLYDAFIQLPNTMAEKLLYSAQLVIDLVLLNRTNFDFCSSSYK